MAAKLLKSKGFKILCRNWRLGAGELDIVALDGNILVFVEVKTLRYRPNYVPADNLKSGQIIRIRRGARKYIGSLDDVDIAFRFDLIEVLLGRFTTKKIFHHQNCYNRIRGNSRHKI